LRDVVYANILLSILLAILTGVGLVQLATFLRGEDLETFAECEVCMVLLFVMMAVVGVFNVQTALVVAKRIRSPQVLRALYFFSLYPVVFLAIMVVNSTGVFLPVLIFGAPMFNIGAVLFPYFAYSLLREAGGYLRTTTLMVACHRCGFTFLISQESSGSVCPMCHEPNRNPLWTVERMGVVMGFRDGSWAAAEEPVVGWWAVKPATLDPDWYSYPPYHQMGRVPRGSPSMPLYSVAWLLQVIAAMVALGIGTAILIDGADWGDPYEIAEGLLIATMGFFGIIGAVKRSKGVWPWVSMAACVLMLPSAVWLSYEVDAVIGIPLAMVAFFAVVFLALSVAESMARRARSPVTSVGPFPKKQPKEPLGGPPGSEGQ
jgi:hypothetical protein